MAHLSIRDFADEDQKILFDADVTEETIEEVAASVANSYSRILANLLRNDEKITYNLDIELWDEYWNVIQFRQAGVVCGRIGIRFSY